MYGQSARGKKLCSAAARKKQLVASQSQAEIFHKLAQQEHFEVAILIATNDCGSGWDKDLEAAYAPYLKEIRFRKSASSKQHKNLAPIALEMLDQYKEHYDMVLRVRPDLLFTSTRGFDLVSAMVKDRTRFTWPNKCEHVAWSNWLCANDAMVAMPSGSGLEALRRRCFGHSSCIPELSLTPNKPPRFDSVHSSADIASHTYSDHGCFRCATREPSIKEHLGFAVNEEMNANARKGGSGAKNPYYSFAEG